MAIIKVDRDTCIGCGSCASICPKSFEMFEGKAREKKSKVEKLTCEEEAMDSCPVNAISIKK